MADTWKCIHLGTMMTDARCVARQHGKDPDMPDYLPPRLEICQDCAQGRRVEARPHDQPPTTTKPGRVACLMRGCDIRASCRGLCVGHYAEWYRGRLDGQLGPWFKGPGNPTLLIHTKDKKFIYIIDDDTKFLNAESVANEVQSGWAAREENKDMETQFDKLISLECRDCGKKADGTWGEVARVFQPNAMSKIGFDGICLECKAAKARKTRDEQRKATEGDQDSYAVTLDFDTDRDIDLWFFMDELARKARRSLVGQIMHALDEWAVKEKTRDAGEAL